jgi:hypothetical protein
LGAGAGDNLTGIVLSLGGAGCGGYLKGAAVGGLGVGAPKVSGLLIGGLGVFGTDFTGIGIAGLLVRIDLNGTLRGAALSAFNYIRGDQRGVTLGLFNYTYKLHGVQIGLLNYVRDNPFLLRLMPLINFSFRD